MFSDYISPTLGHLDGSSRLKAQGGVVALASPLERHMESIRELSMDIFVTTHQSSHGGAIARSKPTGGRVAAPSGTPLLMNGGGGGGGGGLSGPPSARRASVSHVQLTGRHSSLTGIQSGSQNRSQNEK